MPRRLGGLGALAVTLGAVLAPSAAWSPAAAAPVGEVRFAQTYYEARESQGRLVVTVERTGAAVAEQDRVDVVSFPTTADEGDDFVALATTLRFAAGQATARVELTVLDDDRNEGTEELRLGLRDPGISPPSPRGADVTVVILDDDQTLRSADSSGHPGPAAGAAGPPSTATASATAVATGADGAPAASSTRRPTTRSRVSGSTRRAAPAPAVGPATIHLEHGAPAAPARLPLPGPSPELVPAVVVAALLLGRVAALLWHRTRLPATPST